MPKRCASYRTQHSPVKTAHDQRFVNRPNVPFWPACVFFRVLDDNASATMHDNDFNPRTAIGEISGQLIIVCVGVCRDFGDTPMLRALSVTMPVRIFRSSEPRPMAIPLPLRVGTLFSGEVRKGRAGRFLVPSFFLFTNFDLNRFPGTTDAGEKIFLLRT